MNEHRNRLHGDDELAWADRGNCVGVDPDLFFPERGEDTSRARALCRSCPVRSACLEFALESGQRFGIWGGMTPSQRRRLKRHPLLDVVAEDTAVAAPVVRHLHLVRG